MLVSTIKGDVRHACHMRTIPHQACTARTAGLAVRAHHRASDVVRRPCQQLYDESGTFKHTASLFVLTDPQGVTSSPCSSYIFAAGQDQRIRAWSSLTGERISTPLRTPQPLNTDCISLFQHTLEGPISGIQVTEGGGGGGASTNGLTLWAASGKKIYRFWLGQRLDDAVLRY